MVGTRAFQHESTRFELFTGWRGNAQLGEGLSGGHWGDPCRVLPAPVAVLRDGVDE